MYDRTCHIFTVHGCRKYLFTKLNRLIENCPPTQDSLMQHILRAILQSHIWMESIFNTLILDITKWGRSFDANGVAHPVWSCLTKASLSCIRFGLAYQKHLSVASGLVLLTKSISQLHPVWSCLPKASLSCNRFGLAYQKHLSVASGLVLLTKSISQLHPVWSCLPKASLSCIRFGLAYQKHLSVATGLVLLTKSISQLHPVWSCLPKASLSCIRFGLA